MTRTIDNLKFAFSGESQANRKYLSFAKKADEEGLTQIAKLFRVVAYAEAIHSNNHIKALDGVKSTVENLNNAVAGENYEVVSMYPPMIADAETEGNQKAARSFKWALEVEKIHEAMFKKALENYSGKDVQEMDYYVCPFCGYTHEGPLDGNCPVCGAPGSKFVKIT